MKKNILFVDDEKKILDGLKRMLFSMRKEWNMFFANSGKEAMAILQDNAIDVIISDMRMPEIDGAELLNHVKDEYPDIIRFILSGYSDRDMILRTLKSTDQFLTKPCDPDDLKRTICDALNAKKSIKKPDLASYFSEMKTLPTLPDSYLKLKEAIERPTTSFDTIAMIVSKDLSITAKILHLVNSAFFGLRNRIENIKQALTYLGLETLKAVMLTAEVFGQFSEQEIQRFSIRQLYEHSMTVSHLARKIAKSTGKTGAFIDEVSMAGMLHDIGKLILIRNKPDEYESVLNEIKQSSAPSYEVENKVLNLTHAELGAYLMRLWGLPETIVSAIHDHHTILQESEETLSCSTVIYIADILCHQELDDTENPYLAELHTEYIASLGLEEYIEQWRNFCREFKEQKDSLNDSFSG